MSPEKKATHQRQKEFELKLCQRSRAKRLGGVDGCSCIVCKRENNKIWWWIHSKGKKYATTINSTWLHCYNPLINNISIEDLQERYAFRKKSFFNPRGSEIGLKIIYHARDIDGTYVPIYYNDLLEKVS